MGPNLRSLPVSSQMMADAQLASILQVLSIVLVAKRGESDEVANSQTQVPRFLLFINVTEIRCSKAKVASSCMKRRRTIESPVLLFAISWRWFFRTSSNASRRCCWIRHCSKGVCRWQMVRIGKLKVLRAEDGSGGRSNESSGCWKSRCRRKNSGSRECWAPSVFNHRADEKPRRKTSWLEHRDT